MTALIAITARYLLIIVALIAVVATVLSGKTVRNSIIKLAILSFGIAFLIAFVAGICYYDARPFVIEGTEPLVPHKPDNGFPSDYTLVAMVTAAVVFVYRRKLGILLGVLGLFVGIVRVIAQLHYPIDIVGSILIAFIATFCAWMILKKLEQRFKRSP